MQSSVITIGNFDGVHLGHQAILQRAQADARNLNARVVAITFEPHPSAVLRPDQPAPPRLMDLSHRQAKLEKYGADKVVVLEPTPELLNLSAQAFVDRMVDRFSPVAFVEGPDFHFGKGREGNVQTLAQLGQTRNFKVDAVERVETGLSDQMVVPVSSSLVRWLIERGRVVDAGLLLGEPFTLTGHVEKGEQRGRQIGVPTANLHVDEDILLPADGVYAGEVWLNEKDEQARFLGDAAISVGMKPTFEGRRRVVEAHILNYAGDLYDKPIEVRLTAWLRDQISFPHVEALKQQLARDIERVRERSVVAS